MPRESSKTRNWQRERRDRFKDGFMELNKVLPCYDPSVTISRLEILHTAAQTIKNLDEKLKKLLVPDSEEKTKKERVNIIKKLQDRVKKLLVRNEQLSNLLKDAGIAVPSAYGTKKIKSPLLWSNKITPEHAKIVQKKALEGDVIAPKKIQVKKKKFKGGAKQRKVLANAQSRKILPKKRKQDIKDFSSKCVILLSQPSTINPSCFIITNAPSSNVTQNTRSSTVITNSGLLTSPLVSSDIKASVFPSNPAISSLGPGTLILANRTILPVLHQPQTIIPNPTFITNPFHTHNNRSTVIVVTTASQAAVNSNAFTSTTLVKKPVPGEKSLPPLKPMLCLTQTTQVNKVPIPAVTSSCNNNIFVLNVNQTKQATKDKIIVKENKINVKRNQQNHNNDKILKRKLISNSKINLKKPKINEVTVREEGNEMCKEVKNSAGNVVSASSLENDNEENPSGTEKKKEVPVDLEKKTEGCSNVSCDETYLSQLNSTTSTETVPNTDTKTNQTENPNLSCPSSIQSSPQPPPVPPILSQENVVTISTQSSVVSKDKKKISEENSVPVKSGEDTTGPENSVTTEPENSDNLVVSDNSVKAAVPECSVDPTKASAVATDLVSQDIKNLELNLSHSELSNDIFASLQVPSGCQNPESTSPTAAFLLAFPLVSSGVKVTEVIDEDNSVSQRGTPNLLQIGTMDTAKTTQTHSDSLTPSLLNLDNFSFFSAKDICGGFYNHFQTTSATSTAVISTVTTSVVSSVAKPNSTNSAETKTTALEVNAKSITQSISENNLKHAFNNEKIKDSSTQQPNNNTSANSIINYNSRNDLLGIDHINLDPNTQLVQNTVSNVNFQSKNKTNEIHHNLEQKQPLYANKTYNPSCNFNEQKVTSSYSSVSKNYNPLYANGNNLYTNSNNTCNFQTENNFNQNYYKNIPRNDAKSYYPLNYENYTEYRKNENNFTGSYSSGTSHFNKEKYNSTSGKGKSATIQSKPINWMMTPDNNTSFRSDYLITPFSKESDFAHTVYPNNSFVTTSPTAYFNTASMYTASDTNGNVPEIKKSLELPLHAYQRSETEENQFSWSPTKLPQFIEPPHNFVSTTLPTLVGDLALNNPASFTEQKNTKDRSKENRRKVTSYESQSNFLSVSQLVDHNKDGNVPARTTTRRNSGSRSKNSTPKIKRGNNKQEGKEVPNYNIKIDKNNQGKQSTNIYNNLSDNSFCEQKISRNVHKNVSSSYSAEALIGHQVQSEGSSKRYTPAQNKSIMPSFLTENIISYFPPVDISQENNYIQQNQSYQSNSFPHNFTTSLPNNTYCTSSFMPSASTITTTYLPTNNFIHDINTHDYMSENLNLLQNSVNSKDKNCKSYVRQMNKEEKNQNSCTRKFKKRNPNESNLPNFDFPFLSMPGAINSPILPDDFHAHTSFLPPTTLYPCKNPLYPKQNTEINTSALLPPIPPVPVSRGNIPQADVSPSINTAGTSLTNFNLSTIFPEINKGPPPGTYPDSKINKDHHVPRSFPPTSSVQVPFNHKPSFSFGSYTN